MTFYLFVKWLLHIVSILIAVRALLSWFAQDTALYGWLANFTEPFLKPFRGLSRKLMQRTGLPVDLSSVFAIIGIEVIDYLLQILHRVLR